MVVYKHKRKTKSKSRSRSKPRYNSKVKNYYKNYIGGNGEAVTEAVVGNTVPVVVESHAQKINQVVENLRNMLQNMKCDANPDEIPTVSPIPIVSEPTTETFQSGGFGGHEMHFRRSLINKARKRSKVYLRRRSSKKQTRRR